MNDRRDGHSSNGEPLPMVFRSFRNYNYRLFWCGQLVSLMGTWMQRIGQAWLVLDLTQSPVALGTVTMLQFLPMTCLILFGGVIADRLPKRRSLIVTQSAAMLQAFILAALVVTGRVELWHIYVLASVLGFIDALDSPTRQSFVVEMVGRGDVANAVALNSLVFNGARVVGPAIGGAVIVSIGMAGVFIINGVSFLGVLVGLLLMRPHLFYAAPAPPKGSIVGQLVEGVIYAARTPAVLLIVIMLGTISLFGLNFLVVLPLLARFALGVDAAGLGTLTAALGVGSVVAALAVARSNAASRKMLLLGAVGFVIAHAATAASNWYLLSIVLLFVMGATSTVFLAVANTTMQLNSPDGLRGRVMSLYALLLNGTTPIGGLLTGVLADNLGIQPTLGILTGFCALGLFGGWLYLRGLAEWPGAAGLESASEPLPPASVVPSGREDTERSGL